MTTMELVDTHCHLDIDAFDPDREQVLQHCHTLGVGRILVPAIHRAGWGRLQGLCAAHNSLYPALGMHPVFIQEHREGDIEALEREVSLNLPAAIGEIGLDYFVADLDRERQQRWFEAQLEIARNAGLPVILHVRKAHDRMLSTLKRIRVTGGICHAFNGSLQQAQQYIDLGFRLGFGGMLTYERSHKLHRLAAELPLESIVLETDAPDMTGALHHGQRNSPEYLPECLDALVRLRQEDIATIARQTTDNACEVLSLDRASA